MSGYTFNKNAPDGEEATLANGVTYRYNAAKDRWDTIGASGDDLDTKYVKKTGDIMTGDLEVKGVAKATELKSTKLNSGEDTNLSIQRHGDTKFLIAPKETLAYQPIKYNADYTLDHERNLINKGYVDDLVEETVTDADAAYVHKKKDGGDSMEGPLTISGQAGVDSREARRLIALNVFSGTDSSSLQLGTKNTKIYVGHNDTSFNTPLKLNEIQDRGDGITFTGTLKFDDQDVLMDIAPAAGTTQHIKLFDGVGASDDHTTLKVDINGATFKKAIEFESGPSNGKEIIFRLDSNRGVRARNLNMDNTNITKLADPVNSDQAATKAYVDNMVTHGVSNNHGEVAYNMAHTNRSAILSMRDAVDDNLAPMLKVASEDENYRVKDMLLEAATHISPKEDHPLYHIANTDFVLFSRMFEGAKKTEDGRGDIISNNKTLESQRYGNDHLPNMVLFHIPTGKTHLLQGCLVHRPDDQGLPSGVSVGTLAYPSVRGMNIVPRDDGSQDVYCWIHNPLRTTPNVGSALVPKGNACPLYRIHIPAKPDVSNSDPFANVTTRWTGIQCDRSKFTTPANNPYGNYESDTTIAYQYEISPYTFDLVDPITGVRHYFMMSHNKGSKDYVTSRVFQIVFDPSNPDAGEIVPVRAHALSSHGEYASGITCKKKDIYDVEKLFMYGSPMGLTEVYFTNENPNAASTKRLPELRNYAEYIPQGDRVVSDTETNSIGHYLIESKGIADNWYKSTTLNPQPLTNQPYDPKDKLSNIIVWYQSAYGVCSLNVQDLGVIDRSAETKLENNYQGTNLSALHIEHRDNIYRDYIQDFSSRNLARFNTQQLDTHSQGSLWYFDYKADYPFPVDKVGSNDEKHLWNDTRIYNSNGDLIEQDIFKRPIIEVRPNETTGRIEIHCIPTGRARYPYGTEIQDENFCGESITKVNDVFICGGAKASHSSVGEPKLYMFNPAHRAIHRLSNERVDMTSIFPSRKHSIVMGAPYGISNLSTDSAPETGTPIFMVDMQSISNAQTPREKASDLRKLYTLTGNEDMIDEDPETWRLDEPEETSESYVVVDCGSDFDEYDE